MPMKHAAWVGIALAVSCAWGAPEAVPPAAPAAPAAAQPPAPETKVRHAALGASVTASSTHAQFPSERPPSALVDGDLTTRWSSDYSEPQTVEIKLARPVLISTIRIHWEAAAATRYSLSVSPDGKAWQSLYAYMKTDAKPEARVDVIRLKNASAGYIRLDLIGRVNPTWGFSLHEIEVIPAE